MDDRYVAGLFDGEGFVRIARFQKPNSTHIRYAIHLGIGMTHWPVIEALKTEYGGSIHENRHDLRNPKNRIQFMWVAASQVGAAFLRRVLPYLIVKRDEAEIALHLQDHIDANPYKPAGRPKKGGVVKHREGRDDLFAYREELYQQITALKKRSYPSLTA